MVANTEMDEKTNIDVTEDEVDENENEEKPSDRLDFSKLFKMAEDPDLEELLRSALDQALINLEDGSEVQKLTAIRTFPDILDSSDGEKCLQKMLPAIQKCLKVEKSNLDFHCEAAVVYKSIIQNDGLVKKFNGIIEILLENILLNIQHQKEHQTQEKEKVVIRASTVNHQMHHLSAAAWLETIVEVADKLTLSSIKQFIIPVIQQQADPVQRVQRRIIATKIIHKLAMFLPANEIRKDICPTVSVLCKDANSNVRVAISQRLLVVAEALKNSHDVVSCLLPCYIQLINDEEINVREAAMNNMTEAMPLFTRDARKNTIFSNIKKLTEEALEKKNEGLSVITRNFGKWSWDLNELIDQLDKSWILNTYCKMVQISDEKCEGATKNLRNVLKRQCVFNFPCMLMMFKKQLDRLIPFVELFCTDPDEEVRMSIAASYHEMLRLFPERNEFIAPFIELLHGGSPEVISKVASNMTDIIPLLYKNVEENPGKITSLQLNHLIIGCNQILRNTSSWRSHEALLLSIKALPSCVSEDVLIQTFVPLLEKEILNVRAIPCRVAACDTILFLMKHISDESTRSRIINFLNEELSQHTCCYRRINYIDVAETVLSIFSKRIFVQHFLDDTLRLTSDPVSNIRIRAIRFLPKIKRRLRLPDDDDTLLKIEKFVSDVLKSDENGATRTIIQSAAVELSRSETCSSSDSTDEQKIKEEEELWSKKKEKKETKSTRSYRKLTIEHEEEEEDGEATPRTSSLLRPPSVSSIRATSPWRTERKAIAVVRPQPVLTVRAQSPSPMSYRSASPVPKESIVRPSRLPLSAAAKEREKLRRAATDTPPPPSSSRTSRASSVVSSRRSDAMTSSTSSIDVNSQGSNYGLRRSATSGGSSFTSTSSYSLMHARSSSSIRRPGYGLSHVSSSSTFERKPSHVSLRVRNLDG